MLGGIPHYTIASSVMRVRTGLPYQKLARARFEPEPINPNFDTDWFTDKLKNRKTSIKAVLLDQTFT